MQREEMEKKRVRGRHNSLLFNVRSFTPAYCGVHALRLASFQSVGCSARWRGSHVTYKKGHVSQEVLIFVATDRMLTFCLTEFLADEDLCLVPLFCVLSTLSNIWPRPHSRSGSLPGPVPPHSHNPLCQSPTNQQPPAFSVDKRL